MTTPPCRVCGKTDPVMCYPLDTAQHAQTICPDCCVNATHDDGETGHVFGYDREARETLCAKCGLPSNADPDYDADYY